MAHTPQAPGPEGVVGCGVMTDNKTAVHSGIAFVTGAGKAVENVVIEDVRLADGFQPQPQP